MLIIESASTEKLDVLVTTTQDPTGALPSFSIGTGNSPGTFIDGAWVGAWDPLTSQIRAETPLVGDGAALDHQAERGTWRLWARWTVDVEVPVELAEILDVV